MFMVDNLHNKNAYPTMSGTIATTLNEFEIKAEQCAKQFINNHHFCRLLLDLGWQQKTNSIFFEYSENNPPTVINIMDVCKYSFTLYMFREEQSDVMNSPEYTKTFYFK